MPLDLVSRGVALGLQTLNEADRMVDFIASTEALDSYDEVVEQEWDLKRFKKNPVVLFGHLSRELPIGHCTRVEVVKGLGGKKQLECTIKFATADANPVAEQVWQSVLQGTLRAVSVGFMPGDVRREKRDGVEVYVFSKNELHEISVVPIPANPEALAKMRSRARDASAEPQPQPVPEPTNQSDAAMPAVAIKETTDMDLAEALAQNSTLKTTNAELQLQLKDATAKAEAAEKEVADLKKREAERITKDRAERVELAFSTYKDSKKLTEADREAMLVILEAKPDTFEKLYPKVAPNQQHLLANLSESREVFTELSAVGDDAPAIQHEASVHKGIHFLDAQIRASRGRSAAR